MTAKVTKTNVKRKKAAPNKEVAFGFLHYYSN